METDIVKLQVMKESSAPLTYSKEVETSFADSEALDCQTVDGLADYRSLFWTIQYYCKACLLWMCRVRYWPGSSPTYLVNRTQCVFIGGHSNLLVNQILRMASPRDRSFGLFSSRHTTRQSLT